MTKKDGYKKKIAYQAIEKI